MKKLLSFILSTILLLTLSTVVFANETNEATTNEAITVSVNAEFPPFEYYENDVLKGFDIELMNYLAEKLGYEVEYKNKPFEALFLSVMSGETDCAISAITITEERKKNLYYTVPYIASENDGNYENYGIAVGSEELCQQLNSALAIAKADGTVEKLINKYAMNEKGNYSVAYVNVEHPQSQASATTVPAPSEWARESVNIANDLGITYKTEQYIYKNPITRESFCELVYNLIKSVLNKSYEINTSFKFDDTDNETVIILNRLGIINGKTETEFAPDDFLTREEAATIIVRMVNALMPMAATEMWFEFDDINDISDWASDSVQTICNLRFMNGVGNNKFAPKDTYTTEQAIATLVRVYEGARAAGITGEASVSEIPDIGIIGGSDGPTQIIVGDDTTIIGGADAPTQILVTETIEIDDFYIDEAIKLITESGKLAADEEFIRYYTADDEMLQQISALGDVDYSTPTEIYYIAANRDEIVTFIEALFGEEAENVNVEKFLELNKLNYIQLAAMINASYGSEYLAALTILTNSEGYIMPKDFEKDFALYLQYDGEYSALVSFSEFGDGVIKATMSFVNNGDRDNIFSRLYEITQGLGEDSIDVAIVK